ncbi:DUF4839 domain-containing protein [Rhodococcus sp. 06-156-3C]|uniref:DUF4839 domain-containing protein n=1 Tax=Nocardiaceae TaxID=85025 RepID=UPI0006898207|nr:MULTISPECIES: DUF4839 domain-containing protein [Rhodococcus]OZD18343.1 DUF4839 domain-containing protein [Rhodococcus sp. 06-156-4C]OZD18941.1 DUF4839 domain-containing protein [Rhodococcus sp. 06-156-3C]OZD22451.1 DUF4839 domain-containing protein [Rhodococcus sp. 06-156-4a]OZD34035.1 DUF4839 domain-containing protein [Rhodococcus sp. 06-156-3b]OZD38772.1 DUF4839 domain-containing protein [Rhodococcus sp. 06-156-3]
MDKTADTEITYETKTVRAVRGMESRTIKKWEDEGWEAISQTPGKIQTEITLRRPAPRSRRLLWIVGGGVLTLALATIIAIGVVSENNTAPTDNASPAPSEQPSLDATASAPTSPPEHEDVVLTPENSPELATLLTLTDTCSPDIAAFAATHRGQTISFPGSIVAMGPHDGAKTRYDILINAGDFSETFSQPGPSFQFRDENTDSDLHFVGSVPDTIGVGTNLGVTAEVDRYVENQCLFLLEPVATAVR